MKFTLKGILSLLMTMTLMVSCVEEPMHEPVEMDSVVSYTAYSDCSDTKTVLDGNLSKWNGNEWIQIVGRNGNYWFGSNVTSPSSSTVFTYNDANGEFKENDVFAVYPAGSANYGKNFEDMSVSGVTVPSRQTATVGSYDPNAAVHVAYTTDKKLKFKNAVSLLKFTMGSSNIKNVTIWGDLKEVPGGDLPEFVKEGYVYLTIDPEWLSDGARLAAYMWNDAGHAWADLLAVDGQANMYSCSVSGYNNIIFCRMNGGTSANSWDNRWNQTDDLNLANGNHFTITNPWNNGGNAQGSWERFSATRFAGMSGTGTLYYNNGDPVIEGPSNGYVSLNGDFQKGKTYYIAIAPLVLEKGLHVEMSTAGDYDKFEVKHFNKTLNLKRNTIYDMGVLSSNQEKFYTEPLFPNADEPCTIYYRPSADDPQTGDIYAHIWLRAGGESICAPTWGTNTSKYKFTKVSGENLWSLTLSPTVREWFGSGDSACQRIGIIVRNSDGSAQTADYFLKVTDEVHGTPEMPEGLQHGINYIDNSTVTLVLYDRDNQGRSHDYCNLLWDDNWWGDRTGFPKSMSYDDEAGCWWITLTNLNPNKQYKFQYQLGGFNRGYDIQTFDPYTEIIYDTHNDQWVPNYPNVKEEFGEDHYGRASGFVSAFKINKDVYNWKVQDYDIEDKNDLVIYELLVRDFTDNSYGEGSIKNAMKQIPYLKTLGINAVELMPIQEFDGNDSWGYGNHGYFAMDKAYGTRNDYKAFIDECHQNGIAVLLDVVYNHATGAHPYAKMYWNDDKTAENNPWFNVNATHEWSVYHDWNHSNPMVRDHVKRSLTYLMTEYKVDGFRFDLTKGFMQGGSQDGYNQERVDYLKEYNSHIQWVDNHAVMICEHFVDDENWALGEAGIKVWRNMNHSYAKAMKRDMSQADITGTTHGFDGGSGMQNDNMAFGTLVGFMESHDEQRIAYDGKWDYSGAEIPFATSMERAKICAAFFLLTPGPKMIWQFGELGYDISIEDNGRTGKKPCKTTEYMAVPERKALYDTYSMILKFRKDNPRFFDNDVNFRWYVGGGEQTGRYLFARSGEGKHFALFGNFGTGTQNIGVSLPEGVSKWYQYENGAEWNGSSHNVSMAEGQFYLLVSDKSMCK